MVSWQDEAVILSVGRFSESSLKLELLTAAHGRYAGLVKGGASSKRIAGFDIGNIVQAGWRARLSEQLGSFTIELLAQPAASIMHDMRALSALNAAASLVLQCVPERHSEPEIYQSLLSFLKQLQGRNPGYMYDYVAFELTLLKAIGFPLDLARCVATGSTEDLIYVSPKSGCAVCREAGKPYADRLLALPQFLTANAEKPEVPNAEQLREALTLTGFFLNHHAEEITHKPLPQARQMVLAQLSA